jgi:TonB family protein
VGFRCVLVHQTLNRTIAGEVATPTENAAEGDGTLAPSPSERTQPRPIHQVQPDFPPGQELNNEPGNVVLEFTIDEAGRVRDPRVVSSSNPAFEQPALTAVRDWRFEPARQNGQPVACRAIQEFNFRAQPSSRREIP